MILLCHFVVLYISDLAGKSRTPMDRKRIWCFGRQLSQLGVYQPENDGYKVASFSRGITTICCLGDFSYVVIIMLIGTELILSPFSISGIPYIMVSVAAPVDLGVDGYGGPDLFSWSLPLHMHGCRFFCQMSKPRICCH